jgi:thiol-disulfide isomerase/thioredoxin
MSFIVIFIFVILIKNPNSILNYPYNLIDYIQLVHTSKTINKDQLQQLILPTIFFVVLIKYTVKTYKTKVMSLSKAKKKELFITVIKIILATVFFLSAVGKTISFTTFSQKVYEFEFISFELIPYIILFIEYALAFGFMLLIFTKQVARVAFIFLVFMTISYSYGHFFLNITKCDCFGYFKFLTPSNYFIYLIKNSSLIILSIYILKNANSNVNRRLIKTTVSIMVVFLLSFVAYKTEVKLVSGFAEKNEGKAIRDLGLQEYNQLKDYQYWFVFSPKCAHCLDVIPKIEKLKNENNIQLIGVTSIENEEELNKLSINFLVKKINSNEISKLTKTVPKIFELKNDTIQRVLNIKEFIKIN